MQEKIWRVSRIAMEIVIEKPIIAGLLTQDKNEEATIRSRNLFPKIKQGIIDIGAAYQALNALKNTATRLGVNFLDQVYDLETELMISVRHVLGMSAVDKSKLNNWVYTAPGKQFEPPRLKNKDEIEDFKNIYFICLASAVYCDETATRSNTIFRELPKLEIIKTSSRLMELDDDPICETLQKLQAARVASIDDKATYRPWLASGFYHEDFITAPIRLIMDLSKLHTVLSNPEVQLLFPEGVVRDGIKAYSVSIRRLLRYEQRFRQDLLLIEREQLKISREEFRVYEKTKLNPDNKEAQIELSEFRKPKLVEFCQGLEDIYYNQHTKGKTYQALLQLVFLQSTVVMANKWLETITLETYEESEAQKGWIASLTKRGENLLQVPSKLNQYRKTLSHTNKEFLIKILWDLESVAQNEVNVFLGVLRLTKIKDLFSNAAKDGVFGEVGAKVFNKIGDFYNKNIILTNRLVINEGLKAIEKALNATKWRYESASVLDAPKEGLLRIVMNPKDKSVLDPVRERLAGDEGMLAHLERMEDALKSYVDKIEEAEADEQAALQKRKSVVEEPEEKKE